MKKIFLLALFSCFIYGENLKINITKEEMVHILVERERWELPFKIDENAEITNINLIKTLIIETIEVNGQNENIKEIIKKNELEIIEYYYKTKANIFCSDERTRTLIENKIVFAGEIIEKRTKRTMGYYTIEEEDCVKLGIKRKKSSL